MRRFIVLANGLAIILSAGCVSPSAEKGHTLYTENGCASCHGTEGYGDGPLSQKLPVSPINLHDVSLFQHGTSEDAIARTLAEGISLDHSAPILRYTHHELLMPKFDHLNDNERRSIALYVISLRAAHNGGRSQQ